MEEKGNPVDRYIASMPEKTRPALEKMRKIIRAAVPNAEEVISYQMPTYKHHGFLVGFAGYKNHCGFYPWNGHTVAEFANELKGYKTSKAAIQFPINQPLPEALIKKIILKRIEENTSKENNNR